MLFQRLLRNFHLPPSHQDSGPFKHVRATLSLLHLELRQIQVYRCLVLHRPNFLHCIQAEPNSSNRNPSKHSSIRHFQRLQKAMVVINLGHLHPLYQPIIKCLATVIGFSIILALIDYFFHLIPRPPSPLFNPSSGFRKGANDVTILAFHQVSSFRICER